MNQLFKKLFIGENKYKNYDLRLVKKMQYLPLYFMGMNLFFFLLNFSDDENGGWLVNSYDSKKFAPLQGGTVLGYLPTTNLIDKIFFSYTNIYTPILTATTIDTIIVTALLIYFYLFIRSVIGSTVFSNKSIYILKKIGYVSFFAFPIKTLWFIMAIKRYAHVKNVNYILSNQYQNAMNYLFLSALIFFIINLLLHGKQYKEETDLTI